MKHTSPQQKSKSDESDEFDGDIDLYERGHVLRFVPRKIQFRCISVDSYLSESGQPAIRGFAEYELWRSTLRLRLALTCQIPMERCRGHPWIPKTDCPNRNKNDQGMG